MLLAPDLALSSVHDLLACVERCISICGGTTPESAGGNDCSAGLDSIRGNFSIGSVVSEHEVYRVFSLLQESLSFMYDSQGLPHVIPTDVMPLLQCGGIGSIDFVSRIMEWKQVDARHVIKWLVTGPLSYMERTEPFAVLLSVVGLKYFPKYVGIL